MPPRFPGGAHDGERGELPRIEHLLSKAAVEAIDVGVLIGFPGSDVGERDAARLALGAHGFGDKLRGVIAAQLLWRAMLLEEIVEHGDHAHA